MQQKLYNVTIYKNAEMSWTNNAKIATGNWNTYWLNIIGWVGGILFRCNYYEEYLACEQEDFCERYI